MAILKNTAINKPKYKNGEIDSDKKILPNIGVSKGRRLQNTIILNASVLVDANIKKLKAIPGAIRPNITPE